MTQNNYRLENESSNVTKQQIITPNTNNDKNEFRSFFSKFYNFFKNKFNSQISTPIISKVPLVTEVPLINN
jgi:hypothetical protein